MIKQLRDIQRKLELIEEPSVFDNIGKEKILKEGLAMLDDLIKYCKHNLDDLK